MSFSSDLWFLFPVALGVSTLATASGIGGAIFYTPLFIVGLQLEPRVAIGAALITQLFGFSSGLLGYLRTRLIDFRLAGELMLFSVPAALLGTWLSDRVPGDFLRTLFGLGIIIIGIQIFRSWHREKKDGHTLLRQTGGNRTITDCNGRVYQYSLCKPALSRFFALLGGALVGMISVGLAELQEYHLITRCKMPTPVVVATSVFLVMVTVLVASAGLYWNFWQQGGAVLEQVQSIIVFTIPGVLIGGQLGPRLQTQLSGPQLKVGLAVVFICVGVFMQTVA